VPLERRKAPNGIVYYASPLLDAVGVPHAFSTRVGGISPQPFDSLNLGNPSNCDTVDDWDSIYRNYALLEGAIGCAGRPRCWVHQVHGNVVHRVAAGEPFESGPKGDALVSDDAGRIVAVRVADCVPILIASNDGRLVAAVHSGWRGVIADVVGATVASMRSWRSDMSPATFVAAVGPCIGYEAFEVGPEVINEFTAAFGADAPVRRTDDGKGRVDLRRAVKQQLLRAGLTEANVDTSDRCTVRDRDEFFSHRRDRGVTGRMAALISPRGA
jgi:hypothetical protein